MGGNTCQSGAECAPQTEQQQSNVDEKESIVYLDVKDVYWKGDEEKLGKDNKIKLIPPNKEVKLIIIAALPYYKEDAKYSEREDVKWAKKLYLSFKSEESIMNDDKIVKKYHLYGNNKESDEKINYKREDKKKYESIPNKNPKHNYDITEVKEFTEVLYKIEIPSFTHNMINL